MNTLNLCDLTLGQMLKCSDSRDTVAAEFGNRMLRLAGLLGKKDSTEDEIEEAYFLNEELTAQFMADEHLRRVIFNEPIISK
jgi:hypothetical protein